MWWSGNRRSPALTADADSGAGLQGGNDDEVPSSDGDASLAPLEGDSTTTPSDRWWPCPCSETATELVGPKASPPAAAGGARDALVTGVEGTVGARPPSPQV